MITQNWLQSNNKIGFRFVWLGHYGSLTLSATCPSFTWFSCTFTWILLMRSYFHCYNSSSSRSPPLFSGLRNLFILLLFSLLLSLLQLLIKLRKERDNFYCQNCNCKNCSRVINYSLLQSPDNKICSSSSKLFGEKLVFIYTLSFYFQNLSLCRIKSSISLWWRSGNGIEIFIYLPFFLRSLPKIK